MSHVWRSSLSRLYGSLVLARRRAIETSPWRRRLDRPVVSVGNLAVGGRGKTPLVAHLADWLARKGERPAILSRGYGRTSPEDGVVVVHDGTHRRADLARAGDEPAMLARCLSGVPIVVCADRYLAGRLAETRLGATLHLLDDGFQHVQLARDFDVLLATGDDLTVGQVLPAGPLREPARTAGGADALVVPDGDLERARQAADRLGVRTLVTARRHLGVPRLIEPLGVPPRLARTDPVVAVAGIALPGRFFDDLRAGGWNVVAVRSFPDHHRFDRRDLETVEALARDAQASLVLTTEKDVVRWLPLRPLPFELAWVPSSLSLEPELVLEHAVLAAVRAAPRARRLARDRW